MSTYSQQLLPLSNLTNPTSSPGDATFFALIVPAPTVVDVAAEPTAGALELAGVVASPLPFLSVDACLFSLAATMLERFPGSKAAVAGGGVGDDKACVDDIADGLKVNNKGNAELNFGCFQFPSIIGCHYCGLSQRCFILLLSFQL